MTDSAATPRGTHAQTPTAIPARGWKDILLRVKDELVNDHVTVVSAGVAFFGLLATFPAIGAIISIAGFFLDPSQVAKQIDGVVSLLPPNAASIIQDQVSKVTGTSDTASGLAAIFGFVLALYGAMKGVMTLMEGMNIAYEETEKRGYVRLYLTGLGLTVLLIAGVLTAIGAMMVLPMIVDFLPVSDAVASAISILQWPLLAVLAMIGISLIYWIGPSRDRAKLRWISPGAVVATALWLLGTLAFSFYAQNFSNYNETYGTIGGVIALLTWMWLSAYILLFGAELNAEMERQTRRDTTHGPREPMGERGARMADVPPPQMPEGAMGRSSDESVEAKRRDLPEGQRKTIVTVLTLAALWQMIRAPHSGRDDG